MNNMIEKLEEILQTKEAIKTAIENKGQEVGDVPLADYANKINNISSSGGDMSLYALIEDVGKNEDLSTVDKETLVGAINELKAMLDDIGTVTDPDGIVDALNNKVNKETIGNLEKLQTTYKESIVYAINELYLMATYNQGELIDKVNQEDFIYELEGKVSQEDFDAAINAIELTPGQQGPPGQDGSDGEPGEQGLSAYQIWLNEGNAGTEQDFLESLEGADGADGLSAYQIWLNEGNSGTEQDFINSLEGPQGPPGKDGGSGDGGSGGGVDLGSHSSDKIIENYTNEYKVQVNVSENSSATAVVLFINIAVTLENERWYPVNMEYLYGDIEDYLVYFEDVDGAFVYAMVDHWGDEVYIEVMDKEMGSMMGMVTYPVKFAPAPSQVNASSGSETSGYRSQVNASRISTASGENSQVNASQNSTASGSSSQVNASRGSTASGRNSQVNASSGSTANMKNGFESQVNASSDSESSGGQINVSRDSTARAGGNGGQAQVNVSERSSAMGYDVQINSSINSEIEEVTRAQINASESVKNDTRYSSAWGYNGSSWINPSTRNIKIHLLSESGNINHSGVLNSGHNFTDFAELFPNLVGEEQGYGLIQTIDGHGVRPANSGDQVVGVTSATAGVVLGETPFSWQDRWLKDEWGAFIMEDVIDEGWEPNEDKGETEDDRPMIIVPKENPDYDPEREYTKRQERPDEWTVVGLVGQVYVRLDENVQPMDYVKPLKDGVGQTSDEPTNIRVMKITQEFDKDKGYQIGFCLLK